MKGSDTMNKKETLLALLKVLERYTDKDHPLSRKQIVQYMLQEYQIEIDRKTFSRHIDTLISFNYDIKGPIRYNNKYCYYLQEHLFEKYEAHLLVNSIYHSHYLSPKASDDFIDKIFSTLSIHQEKELKEVSALYHNSQAFKNHSHQFFLNIEMILEAIAQQKAIQFHYLTYNLDKQLVRKRPQPYLVKPYAVICSNDNIYMIAGSNERNSIIHMRIEKIEDITLVETDQLFPILNEPPYQYIRNKTKMFQGEAFYVTLKCDHRILGYMIEEWGNDIHIQPCDDEHFLAYVNASEEGLIYYILQYIRYIEVIQPVNFRQQIAKILNEALLKHI